MPKTSFKKKFASIAIILLLCTTLYALSTVRAQTYEYVIQGPFFMNGSVATGNAVTCDLLWRNYTTTQFTLDMGSFTQILYSDAQLYQITWNASSAMNYTSLIDFQIATTAATQYIDIFIPNPSYPFDLYTFQVSDFAGMTNPYLRLTVNNASGINSATAGQVALNSTDSPAFVLTKYYTYTLTVLCDQGTYSRQFTAENTVTTAFLILAGMFPTTNFTYPTVEAHD